MNFLVRGNTIEKISDKSIPTDRRADPTLIDGKGKTLMPGLIDAHTHLMICSIPQIAALAGVRDLGGPVLELKKGIDQGWPCGAFTSQTSCWWMAIHWPTSSLSKTLPKTSWSS